MEENMELWRWGVRGKIGYPPDYTDSILAVVRAYTEDEAIKQALIKGKQQHGYSPDDHDVKIQIEDIEQLSKISQADLMEEAGQERLKGFE